MVQQPLSLTDIALRVWDRYSQEKFLQYIGGWELPADLRSMLEEVLERDRLELVPWSMERSFPKWPFWQVSPKTSDSQKESLGRLYLAAKRNDEEEVPVLLAEASLLTSGQLALLHALLGAVDSGNLVQAVDLANQGFHWQAIRTELLLSRAAAGGILALVQWITRQRSDLDVYEAVSSAAIHHHPEIVRWLLDATSSWEMTMMEAAGLGELALIQLLVDLGAQTDHMERAMMTAAETGHLTITEWLYQQGVRSVEVLNDSLELAVDNDRIESVWWLLEHGASDIGGSIAIDAESDDIARLLRNWPTPS